MNKRLEAPAANNKYYISDDYGGYNKCIIRNSATGSVLPNCVGYAWGRFSEIMGKPSNLCTYNAENWWGAKDGYERGQTPKPGAVICWRKGAAYNQADGAGHVAVVEEVYSNGDILTSNSDYYGKSFYTRVYTKASGYNLGSAYTFQGFIYNPAVEEEVIPNGIVGKPVAEDSTKDQVKVLVTGIRVRKRPELNDAVILGFIAPGVYNVYEQRDMRHEASNGYLWYRFDDSMWIASKEGEWTEFHKGVPAPSDSERVKELEAQVAALNAQVVELEKANANLATEKATAEAEVERLMEIIDIIEDAAAEA